MPISSDMHFGRYSAQTEMLELMAKILQFTDQDKERVGLLNKKTLGQEPFIGNGALLLRANND